MQTTAFKHIAQLVDILVQNNIKNVVISPGSRNAPLIIAFDSHPDIKTYIIHDERSAAFFALGLIDELKTGVAIVCTSGSAPLNYAPAIAEAYYRHKPLLILTADRPEELIDQGDGQCIRQYDVYHNYIKQSCLLDAESNQKQILFSLQTLLSVPQGPVHINIPLAEPLYNLVDYQPDETPIVELLPENDLSFNDQSEIKNIWNQTDKKLIIIGQLTPDVKLQNLINDLAANTSVAILVENTSNIQHFEKLCHNIDRVLAVISEDEIEDFKPELLISLGGAIISKKIKAFFRKHKPIHNWRIGNFMIDEDTYQSKTKSFKVSPHQFFEYVTTLENNSNSNFGNKWKAKDFLSQEKHNQFLEEADFSDLKVFDFILDTLPENCTLAMANSSVVRYCQLFNPVKSITYYANRGVSGIDGSTSTALGMAVANPDKLVVLITGDLSFFYDSNALWNSYLPSNFRIILINNNGGGIFKIIGGPKSVPQTEIFVAPHHAKAKPLCEAFNVNYVSARSISDLENQLYQFYNSNDTHTKLLEVFTKDIANSDVLDNYFKFISSK
ncbi:MAG: 2-succinyl-5-enolpyruvyl-6-hydroxy-3-cyclohexene-1-carboxylic-acid synthase [Putridiphycobacter sp.]